MFTKLSLEGHLLPISCAGSPGLTAVGAFIPF